MKSAEQTSFLLLIVFTIIISISSLKPSFLSSFLAVDPNMKCFSGLKIQDESKKLASIPKIFSKPGFIKFTSCEKLSILIKIYIQKNNTVPSDLIMISGGKRTDLKVYSSRIINTNVSKLDPVYLIYPKNNSIFIYREYVISKMKYSAWKCNPVLPLVVPATGGVYNSYSQSASAIFSVPIKIKYCSEGTISFNIKGKLAAMEFPRIRLSYLGTSKIIDVSGVDETYSVPIDSSGITFNIINPYRAEINSGEIKIVSVTIKDSGE